jgi:hypothetical protein
MSQNIGRSCRNRAGFRRRFAHAGGAGSGANFRRGWASAHRHIVPMGARPALPASGSGGAVAVSERRRGAEKGRPAIVGSGGRLSDDMILRPGRFQGHRFWHGVDVDGDVDETALWQRSVKPFP